VLNWDDGNLYYVVDQFGDAERRDELKEPFSPQTSFVIDGFAYEEMGSPDISTLEALKDALKQAREKFGTSFALYDGRIAEASSDSSMGQTINRLMGGQNLCSIQPDGTVRLNFQDEEYYRAAKYINSLYLDGTFNPENFTITSEQFKQLLEERQIFAYIGHNWAILSGYEGGLDEGAPYQLWDYPIAEGVDPKDVKLMDSYGNVGVNYATFINADTEYPDRAIGYMAFMLSDAGQIMVREGIDGLTYTLDGEGIPHPTELRREYERGPVDKLTKELGMNNAKFAWFTSNWAYSLARHLRIENEQPYYGPSLWTAKPYASWERLNVLSGIIVDTDLLAIRTQIFTLWNNALPSLYLAKTDAEFDAAYQKLISDARLLGLDTLESAYAANYKKYYDRGIR
jgi:putative aldouronate transport system substrate-binding protein